MAHRVVWTEFALERVAAILEHIAAHDPRAAQRAVDEIFDRVGILADHPEAGPAYETLLEPALRTLVIVPYRIFYLVHGDSQRVAILTIRHSRERPLTDEELSSFATTTG
jgi:plasmid stabilization system protein ParE